MFGAALTAVAAPLLVLLDAPIAVRMPFVLALLCLAPGVAWLTAVRGRAEPGLVIGISLGVAGVAAQSMLWLGIWRPRPVLYAVAAACLLPLTARLAATGVPVSRGALARIKRGRLRDRRLRPPGLAITSTPAMHAALISAAVVVWAASLLGADLGRMTGVGLLAAMPPTYFLAFALLLVGFVAAVTNGSPSPRVLGAYVLAFVVVIHATTALLYDEPRYAWTYPHLGVIDLIAATGGADRQIDIYNNWPLFFALNAWFSKTSGLAVIAYAGWAQLFFNVFNVFAVRFALRGLTRNERVLWTAACSSSSATGSDRTTSPRRLSIRPVVVVLGLCLRCGREVTDPRYWPNRRPAWLSSRIATAVVPPRMLDDERAAPPIGPRTALLVGGVCYLAIVTSHQLSPVMLTSACSCSRSSPQGAALGSRGDGGDRSSGGWRWRGRFCKRTST